MMSKSFLGVGALVLIGSAASLQAANIIVLPVTGGQFGGMNTLNGDGTWNADRAYYHNLSTMLDNQPTSFDGTTGMPAGQPKVGGDNWGTKSLEYPGGWGFLDFGANWQDVRITQAWTQSREWAGGPATPYTELYWSDSTTEWIHSTGNPSSIEGAPIWADYLVKPADAVEETTLNFVTQAQSGSGFIWSQDLSLAEANAIVPQGRYLVMHSAKPGTAVQEIALGGYIAAVPEPGTVALAGVAITGLVLSRRRNA